MIVRLWKFPDQVVRLAILFAIAAGGLIGARRALVPKTFGELGHYRAAAVTAAAELSLHYAGRETCRECHPEMSEKVTGSYHRTLACEVCHGPAAAHVGAPDEHKPRIPRARGAACLYCHEYQSSRPTGFPQIVERAHNPLEPCITCHNPHDPKPPHTPSTCAACHAEIVRTKSVSAHARLDCEKCHEVPSEHRLDPRAALAQKPTHREFCGRCHGTDARGAAEIPRVDISTHGGAYPCWQCHYPHDPER